MEQRAVQHDAAVLLHRREGVPRGIVRQQLGQRLHRRVGVHTHGDDEDVVRVVQQNLLQREVLQQRLVAVGDVDKAHVAHDRARDVAAAALGAHARRIGAQQQRGGPAIIFHRFGLGDAGLDGLLHRLHLCLIQVAAAGDVGKQAHHVHVVAPVGGGEKGAGHARLLQHLGHGLMVFVIRGENDEVRLQGEQQLHIGFVVAAQALRAAAAELLGELKGVLGHADQRSAGGHPRVGIGRVQRDDALRVLHRDLAALRVGERRGHRTHGQQPRQQQGEKCFDLHVFIAPS